MSTEHLLLVSLLKKLKDDALVLPTLPEVAMRVQEVVGRSDASLKQVAEVIGQDAAISARIIKVANSALYSRGVPAESINSAVSRIGLIQIKSIATSVAMEQLFISTNEMVWEVMDEVWRTSIDVTAAACAMLQMYNKRHSTSRLNFDTLTLAGLVHNIGALPVLTEAEAQPHLFTSIDQLRALVRKMQGPLGRAVLKSWDFSTEVMEVVERWADLPYLPDHVTYLDFIRAAAFYTGELRAGTELEQRLGVFVARGLPVTTDDLASDEFMEKFHSIRESYQ
ncbi:HDOD domain-containing protein [Shewanella baltica]|uniref:HDOD domain-containing protein n=3 Tax=Shewanella TaxID=22 RepID=A0ABU3FW96_9GAMM|nr:MULTISPECIES: HDOD domain-containing protein [Shewanella]ABN62678.1 putative signal transduction protein [Shewanella baltica OS155]ABS09321.1 putative signal transduction protein [Shewanella baltica OS185]ABX50497.1 putative signal transduction protein [Shewanella baltica OS195]ACK45689.1 putative signal transduction protein [Shewanella baltica OS223]ADT95484.1 putative signal transduction protein [Shewanella baltica OS678]